MRRMQILIPAMFVFAALGFGRPALAAPQILALVATPEPVPLTCVDGNCRAELSAFCMQRSRPEPGNGVSYTLHDTASVAIVARAADGRTVRLPLGPGAKIYTARSYTAVAVNIAEASLAGLTDPAIEVAPETSLIPDAVPGDPDPLSEREIAYTTGPMRQLAEKVLARNAVDRDAATIVSRLVNALPEIGRISRDERNTLWRRVISDGRGHWSTPGMRKARENLDYCEYRNSFYSWRNCLTYKHDSLMMHLNTDYWNAAEPGS